MTMYEELVTALQKRAVELPEKFSKNAENIDLLLKAADAIEKLNRYAAQMDKLREDGWYLLQETAGTYGPITMKMPIPEPLSCDDVLAIINEEPPKEETCTKN